MAKGQSRMFVMVLGLVGAITAAIVGVVMWDSAKASQRQTAQADVVGFAATPREWWDGEDHEQGHTLTFSYVDAANQVHTRTMEQITWYDDASKYHVCYNPADSTDWKLYPSDHTCGS